MSVSSADVSVGVCGGEFYGFIVILEYALVVSEKLFDDPSGEVRDGEVGVEVEGLRVIVDCALIISEFGFSGAPTVVSVRDCGVEGYGFGRTRGALRYSLLGRI